MQASVNPTVEMQILASVSFFNVFLFLQLDWNPALTMLKCRTLSTELRCTPTEICTPQTWDNKTGTWPWRHTKLASTVRPARTTHSSTSSWPQRQISLLELWGQPGATYFIDGMRKGHVW
jgi:hypothetical protein